ncbi:hypothetical protein QFC22_000764 [Naganishia vaughanmartiniae]|uniref:Uncharacterized protein n=1 Tax=Naganishia vaughanmartiniae TaxID=1424756 RepID=A0ACC2XJE4_9TREE|nr:hypothetical protein QFC22_000764 [Naganishia vaughanmartiniae]
MDIASESAFNPISRAATPKPAESGTDNASAGPSSHGIVQDRLQGTVDNPNNISTDSVSANTATLEDEVGQVVQQLSSWGGSLWGGFRKQSAFAFDTVKKDLSRTVREAQDDLKKLQTQTVEVELRDPAYTLDETPVNDKGKGKEPLHDVKDPDHAAEATAPLSNIHVPTTQETKEFFAKIGQTFSTQSTSINQNLATLQKSLSESLAVASSNPQLQSLNLNKLTRNDINFAQFSTNIQKNLAQAGTKLNLQQAEKLAEEYLKKSEGLLHDAGEFLKDAVKVVPPEDGDGQAIAWDGSDMYSFSTAGQSARKFSNSTLVESGRSASTEVSRSQLRKEALLHRLRADKELFLVDPSAETESTSRREAFARFLETHVARKAGIEAEALDDMKEAELSLETKDVETLKQTRDELVPSHLAEDVFWTRYFFHKFAIEEEERKRQQLLQGKLDSPQEDDFSWDAEDELPQLSETAGPVTTGAAVLPSSSTSSSDAKAGKTVANPVNVESSQTVQSIGTTDSSTNSTRISEESYVAVKTQKAASSDKSSKISDDSHPGITKQEGGNDNDDEDDDSDWE